jgi:hypothetical protein
VLFAGKTDLFCFAFNLTAATANQNTFRTEFYSVESRSNKARAHVKGTPLMSLPIAKLHKKIILGMAGKFKLHKC